MVKKRRIATELFQNDSILLPPGRGMNERANFTLAPSEMAGAANGLVDLLTEQVNWLKPAWMLRWALSIQEKFVDN